MSSRRLGLSIIIFLVAAGLAFFVSLKYQLYTKRVQIDAVSFEVKAGDSVASLAERLAAEKIISSPALFAKYAAWKKADKTIQPGQYTVQPPVTMARVVATLSEPGVTERVITIIPGWDLRDLAEYFEKLGIASPPELFAQTGEPAKVYYNNRAPSLESDETPAILQDKPASVGYEGYLAPETYRIYKSAKLPVILQKLVMQRDNQFTTEMYAEMTRRGRSVHEILTMASLLEREVKHDEDKAKVADIFWRRHDVGMGLQADSSVHYAVGKKGNVFTTAKDRASGNPWNTYKYPKLPPGPICNPGLESIKAAIYPEANDYWYFLTTLDTGEVKYARTLAEHNENARRFLQPKTEPAGS